MLALPGAGSADHGFTYEGHYANAFVAGKARDGREVAVMAGFHTDFPYHHRGSGYDQIAVYVEGRPLVVVTERPAIKKFNLALNDGESRMRYRGPRVRFDLRFRAVEHAPLYEGDPADLGDLALALGLGEGSDRRPGFVYVPYELRALRQARLILRRPARGDRPARRERIRLRRLTGQGEAGTVDAPDDPRFRSAYNYIAVAPVSGPRYAYVGFEATSLHSGAEGVLAPYFAATASDELTMQRGMLSRENTNGAPDPLDNTAGALPNSRTLGRFDVDLGPGILNRALFRVRDRAGAPVIALSETITEDHSAD